MRNFDHPTRYGRIFPPNTAWLSQRPQEPALEPDLSVIDAHHHLWHRPDQRYLLPEFLADLDTGHRITATVFVQCHAMYRASGPEEMRPVGETEFVSGIAAMSDSGASGPTRVAAGIVGFADLRLGDRVEPVLEAHMRAGGGRFRGVRHSAAWDADPVIGNGHPAPHLLQRADFRAGLQRLTALGLSFDLWVFHTQLDEALDLVRACPSTSFILGHCGGPLGYGPYANRTEEVFAHWKAGMTALARCPNVAVKLGGMMMRLAAYDYGALPLPPTSAQLAAYWRPYIETCIDLFGADRCLFESNFPVEKMGIGYSELWNAFKLLAAGASADEKRALFSGTSERVYRLQAASRA
ncbi:amidohydrolase family protein [Siccirubricoccus sp. KC 17139]|uniref:Amidohydrolase family protein n=1 Tax=Siccirubricoccus soli TaxID=2899147 RepID=A0ABT1CYW1_9PROT|nr:amidohydrolase family protein [Siccirubricoccus soli]MCO6414846.1 amidohydrolase family protein [Siccirubricoccus soli]MCP2680976.1 amidohydrolase family protein [Siccirubricoccus soli]